MAFTDSSTNNFQLSAFGNAQISTSVKKYGSGSAFFDGNGDQVITNYNSAFDFGLGDFTVEMWVYIVDIDIYAQGLVGTNQIGGFGLQYDGFNKQLGIGNYLVSWEHQFPWNPLANTWYHVALCRSSGFTKAFINGQQIGTTKNDTSKNYSLNGGALVIGKGDEFYNGYIDDLRITKGVARYTANFTPPQQQLPAPSDQYADNVSLLLHMDWTEPLYQNLLAFWKLDNLNDVSANQRTLTNNSSVQFVSGKIGNCAQFNGSNSLTVLNPNTTTVNTKSFSFWVKRTTSNTSQQGLICGLIAGWYIHTTNNKLSFWPGVGGFNPESNATLPVNTWVHCVVIYDNPTLKFYINGVLDTNISLGANASISQYTNICLGAAQQGQLHFTGELDAVGIWNRVLTESEISELYNSGTGREPNLQTFTDSSSNNFTLSAFGDAQISTSVKKFGSGSGYFDGSGDHLRLPGSETLAMGTGDYTIEMWMYLNSNAQFAFIDTNPAGTSGTRPNGFCWYIETSLMSRFFTNGVNHISTATGVIPLNQWFHAALVRNSGTTTIYINGISVGSTNSSYNATAATGGSLIGTFCDALNFSPNGYIDELRITKGVARYTSNFVPHTAPFVNPALSIPLSGLLVRFNADSGVAESGGSITSWTDQQNGVVASAFNGPTLLTNEFNGRKAVSFDGTNDHFTFTLPTPLQNTSNRTYVLIGKYTNSTGRPQNGMLNSLTPSQDRAYVFHNAFTSDAYFYTGSSQYGPKSFTPNAYMIQSIVHRTSGSGFIRINGVQGGTTGANTTQTINSFVIGGRGTSSEIFLGTIVELLIYDRELTTAEIQQIEAYANIS